MNIISALLFSVGAISLVAIAIKYKRLSSKEKSEIIQFAIILGILATPNAFANQPQLPCEPLSDKTLLKLSEIEKKYPELKLNGYTKCYAERQAHYEKIITDFLLREVKE